MNLELTDREQILLEACLRVVLNDQSLLSDPMTVDDYTAVLGSFGEKPYKLENPLDWVSTLKDLRAILDKLNPEWVELCQSVGAEPYILDEELVVRGVIKGIIEEHHVKTILTEDRYVLWEAKNALS